MRILSRMIRRVLALALLVGVVTTLVLPATVTLAAPAASQEQSQVEGQRGEDGFLDPQDFNIFGTENREMLNTGLGRMLGRLLLRIMVIGFDASLIAGIAVLFWKLILLLTGKAGRESVMGRLADMLIAILGVVVILTGGFAMILNYLMKGAEEIQQELSMVPPAVAVSLNPTAGLGHGRGTHGS